MDKSNLKMIKYLMYTLIVVSLLIYLLLGGTVLHIESWSYGLLLTAISLGLFLVMFGSILENANSNVGSEFGIIGKIVGTSVKVLVKMLDGFLIIGQLVYLMMLNNKHGNIFMSKVKPDNFSIKMLLITLGLIVQTMMFIYKHFNNGNIYISINVIVSSLTMLLVWDLNNDLSKKLVDKYKVN